MTTRGRKSGRPREIEIWFTQFENCFYVIAEYATSRWVNNLQADPAVQVKVAGQTFPAMARIVTEPDLRQAIQKMSQTKYGWGDGTVVELTPTENQPQRTQN